MATLVPQASRGAPTRLPEPPALDLAAIRPENGQLARTKAGDPAELTLDPQLSEAALELLERAHPVEGAVVALDARTGRVLVWAGLSQRRSAASVITSAVAPAASVFKLVTTTALFETAGVRPDDQVCISGGLRGIERSHLEPARGAGAVCAPFGEALGRSKNAVYAQLATRHLLRDDLIAVGSRLGFNANVPFDQPVPVGTLSVPYNDLEFARTAVGFRGSTLSPLGGAYLASVIAGGGVAKRLHLLARAGDYAAPREPELVGRVMSANSAWRLTRMMELTVHSGTARPAFVDEHDNNLLPNVRVAGKTGTLRVAESGLTTSWFVGFAPSREPRIVVSAMLQNGDVWRERAAEVARDLLRVYFHGRGVRGVTDPLAVERSARSSGPPKAAAAIMRAAAANDTE